MPKAKDIPSDFEVLTLFVQRLKRFSYKELQGKARKIQRQHKLFQIYFNNCGDVEGAAAPESLQLSFHFKVLYELGYIQPIGTEYATTEKCKKEADAINQRWATSEAARKILSHISSQ